MLRKELLGIMACPRCRGGISERGMFVLCMKCGLAFPVIEGIPDMIAEDAWKLEKAEKANFAHGLKL